MALLTFGTQCPNQAQCSQNHTLHDMSRCENEHASPNQRERERDLLQVPHFFVGTLQPLQADWKGRPQCVCCFSANVQIPLFGLPQGKSLGPHVKDQELNPRPHTQPCGCWILELVHMVSSKTHRCLAKGQKLNRGQPLQK